MKTKKIIIKNQFVRILLSWKKSLVILSSFKSLPVKSRISRDVSEPNERGNEQR